jgi:hypothetical protein
MGSKPPTQKKPGWEGRKKKRGYQGIATTELQSSCKHSLGTEQACALALRNLGDLEF